MEKHLYSYNGPVMEFDRCIADHWKDETMATSVAKARSNMKYHFKQQTGRASSARIDLPGKIVRKDES